VAKAVLGTREAHVKGKLDPVERGLMRHAWESREVGVWVLVCDENSDYLAAAHRLADSGLLLFTGRELDDANGFGIDHFWLTPLGRAIAGRQSASSCLRPARPGALA